MTATIACPTAGTAAYRTTNGTAPTASSTKSNTATFTGTGTLRAICAGAGYTTSAVTSAVYTITASTPKPAPQPTFAPGASLHRPHRGDHHLSALRDRALLTKDGSTPSVSSTQDSRHLRDLGHPEGDLRRRRLRRQPGDDRRVRHHDSPRGGRTDHQPGDDHHLSAIGDHRLPDVRHLVLPHHQRGGSPIASTQSATATFSSSGTLRAVCAGTGYTVSPERSVTYTITTPVAVTPTITPGTSTSTRAVTATITCSSAGTLSYRTTNGTAPTVSSTQSATATFSTSGMLRAICAGRLRPQRQQFVTYTITAATPVASAPNITPGAGSATSAVTAVITADTGHGPVPNHGRQHADDLAVQARAIRQPSARPARSRPSARAPGTRRQCLLGHLYDHDR